MTADAQPTANIVTGKQKRWLKSVVLLTVAAAVTTGLLVGYVRSHSRYLYTSPLSTPDRLKMQFTVSNRLTFHMMPDYGDPNRVEFSIRPDNAFITWIKRRLLRQQPKAQAQGFFSTSILLMIPSDIDGQRSYFSIVDGYPIVDRKQIPGASTSRRLKLVGARASWTSFQYNFNGPVRPPALQIHILAIRPDTGKSTYLLEGIDNATHGSSGIEAEMMAMCDSIRFIPASMDTGNK